jgi:hypothetical protein
LTATATATWPWSIKSQKLLKHRDPSIPRWCLCDGHGYCYVAVAVAVAVAVKVNVNDYVNVCVNDWVDTKACASSASKHPATRLRPPWSRTAAERSRTS